MIKSTPSALRVFKTMICLMGLVFTTNSYANLFVNGSFEEGNFIPLPAFDGTMTLNPGQTNLTGWTVINTDVGWLEFPHPWADLRASDGNRFLDLTDFPSGPPFGGVSQDITTISGESYELFFDLGSSTDYGNVPSAITVNVGATSQTFTSAQPTETNEWTTFSLLFSALSTTTTISFVGASGLQYIGLDNVSVLGTSAVPIPAAAWLFGTALIGFVGMSRRRKVA